MHLNLSFAIDEEGEEYDNVDIFNDHSSLLEVVEKCSPELRQFGVNTRVWTVHPSARPISYDTHRLSDRRSTRLSIKDQAESGYVRLAWDNMRGWRSLRHSWSSAEGHPLK